MFLLSLVILATRSTAAAFPGSSLQKLVDGAIAVGAKRLVVPPGDYLFNTTKSNFELHSASGLTVEAKGVTVWLWPGAFVDVRHSHMTTIGGLTVDFDPPCFSQGKAVAVDPASHSFKLAVDPGFVPPDLNVSPQFNATEVRTAPKERHRLFTRVATLAVIRPTGSSDAKSVARDSTTNFEFVHVSSTASRALVLGTWLD
jgi:hypothetical protein